MSYEIPKELEYKEKIVFGLTFKQVFYAALWCFPLLLVLRSSFMFEVKLLFSLLFVGLGLLWVYTPIASLSVSYLLFLLGKLKDKNYSYSLKENIIIFKGKECAVLSVEPLNFSLYSDKQKQHLISCFQKFLNSLDFPVQLVVTTTPVPLKSYLHSLQKNKYKLLGKNLAKEIHYFITQKGVKNRLFHVVIPKSSKSHIQEKVCEQALLHLGVTVHKPLKGEIAYLLKDLNQPIEEKKDHLIVNNSFVQTIYIKGYPRIVHEGFLDELITLPGDFSVSLQLTPFSIKETLLLLNRQLQKQKADLWALEKKEVINPSLDITFADTQSVLKRVHKGEEKLFAISLTITCSAVSYPQLLLLRKRIMACLQSLLLDPIIPLFSQKKLWLHSLPLGQEDLQRGCFVTSRALSTFFPFTSPFLVNDTKGIIFGYNKNNLPIIKDIFSLQNANGLVLASSGSGKSFFTKIFVMRQALEQKKIFIIDPQAEYTAIVAALGGEVITLSRTECMINILDLFGHRYDEKRMILLEVFPLLLGELSEMQIALLDRALRAAYEEKGIIDDEITWLNEPPILGDVLRHLLKKMKHAAVFEREVYRSLANRLEMYVTGVLSFLNVQTRLRVEKPIVCFTIGDMPARVQPVLMFLLLDYVYSSMKSEKGQKILVIDEAWSLLEKNQEEGYVFRIIKTCRKFGMGLLLITQDVQDVLYNKAGKALLNNAEYTLLLKQKPVVLEDVKDLFHLSSKEVDLLRSAARGEGLLLFGNERYEIHIFASEMEREIIES